MTLKPQFYFSPDSGEHFTYLDHSQKMRTDDKSALENPPPKKFVFSQCTAMVTPFKT